MGMLKPLTADTLDTVIMARRIAHDALYGLRTPGVIDAEEAIAILNALDDSVEIAQLTHDAGDLAHAVICGVGRKRREYLHAMQDRYETGLDVLMGTADAA